jgi:hypothetical protein
MSLFKLYMRLLILERVLKMRISLSLFLFIATTNLSAFQTPLGQTPQEAGVLKPVPGGDQPVKTETPAKAGDVEDEDPAAVAVINEAKKVEKKAEAAKAVAGLGDEKEYDKQFRALVAAIGDQSVSDAMNECVSGRQGPHILVNLLEINDKNFKTTANVRTKSTWYIWRKGIGFEEYSGTRLFGVSKLDVLTVMGPFNDGSALAKFEGIEYRALVKKKLPANVQSVLGLLKIIGFAGQASVTDEYLYGFGTLKKVAVVSDITVGAYFRDAKDDTKLHRVGSKVLLDNEGYHWWDVSIGFPIKRVEELEYNQTGNIVQSRQVDKSMLYALGDIYFRSVDIKNPGARFSPALVVGTGLKGKVRDNLLVGFTTNFGPIPGVSWTKSSWWHLFRPFAGIQFINVSRPVDNPAPGAPGNRERTIHKLSVGLNIPVLTTIERLVAKTPATPTTDTTPAKKTASAGTGTGTGTSTATTATSPAKPNK